MDRSYKSAQTLYEARRKSAAREIHFHKPTIAQSSLNYHHHHHHQPNQHQKVWYIYI